MQNANVNGVIYVEGAHICCRLPYVPCGIPVLTLGHNPPQPITHPAYPGKLPEFFSLTGAASLQSLLRGCGDHL